MLSLLHIENIAVIQSADIRFDQGFNALKDYIETYRNGRMVCAQNIQLAIEEADQAYGGRLS